VGPRSPAPARCPPSWRGRTAHGESRGRNGPARVPSCRLCTSASAADDHRQVLGEEGSRPVGTACCTIQSAVSRHPSSAGRTQKSTSCRSCGLGHRRQVHVGPADSGRKADDLARGRVLRDCAEPSSSVPSTSTQRPPTRPRSSRTVAQVQGTAPLEASQVGQRRGSGRRRAQRSQDVIAGGHVFPLRAEALARHRRQLTLASPGIGMRDRGAEAACRDAIGPGPRQHPRAHPGDDALVERHQPRAAAAAPREELVVQVDPHRAGVGQDPHRVEAKGSPASSSIDVRGEPPSRWHRRLSRRSCGRRGAGTRGRCSCKRRNGCT